MNKPKVLSIVAQLPSLDFAVSKLFYVEFYIVDPSGNLLKFGQKIEE